MCPGPICLMVSGVGSPWAWRNWLSVGTTSSRFAAPPILPRPLWYNVPRAPMPDGKRCKMSLGLEPSLRAGSLHAYGIIKIGRNALAFLGNAVDKRRVRTAWGSIHGIIKIGRNALAFLGNAAFKHRLRTAWGSVHGILYPGFLCLKASDVKALGDIPGIRKALM